MPKLCLSGGFIHEYCTDPSVRWPRPTFNAHAQKVWQRTNNGELKYSLCLCEEWWDACQGTVGAPVFSGLTPDNWRGPPREDHIIFSLTSHFNPLVTTIFPSYLTCLSYTCVASCFGIHVMCSPSDGRYSGGKCVNHKGRGRQGEPAACEETHQVLPASVGRTPLQRKITRRK